MNAVVQSHGRFKSSVQNRQFSSLFTFILFSAVIKFFSRGGPLEKRFFSAAIKSENFEK